ncbi:MAG: hypothetical protein V4795_07470 [Pseudomonadota bacterium]
MPAAPPILRRTPLALACTACLLASSGCALIEPDDRSQANGEAARGMLAQQVLNPEAPRQHAGLVPATNGRITRETADRLVFSFKEPPPPANVITLGVTGR